ncbi:hypothetical protein [Leptospira interrogans]|uniref:hypothetical protein n=1 Tax=Leptospira interrogans TaxID=173 RepID=UPI000A70CA76|nr:hypothetical protein [Leptospira interrogans]
MNNTLIKLNVLVLLGIAIVSCSSKSEKKGDFMEVEKFANQFISEYLERKYMFSEEKEMKDIEKRYFDDDTTIDPGGDLASNPYIYVSNGFEIKNVNLEETFYGVNLEFKIIEECKINKDNVINLSCAKVSKIKKSRMGIRKTEQGLKVDFDFDMMIVGPKLFESYVKRNAYKITR